MEQYVWYNRINGIRDSVLDARMFARYSYIQLQIKKPLLI